MVEFISEAILSPTFLLLFSYFLLLIKSVLDTNLFRFSISPWVSFGNLCVFRSLSIESRLHNLLANDCTQYSFIIFAISVTLVVLSPLFLIFGCVFSLFYLVKLQFVYSVNHFNQLLVSLILFLFLFGI